MANMRNNNDKNVIFFINRFTSTKWMYRTKSNWVIQKWGMLRKCNFGYLCHRCKVLLSRWPIGEESFIVAYPSLLCSYSHPELSEAKFYFQSSRKFQWYIERKTILSSFWVSKSSLDNVCAIFMTFFSYCARCLCKFHFVQSENMVFPLAVWKAAQ